MVLINPEKNSEAMARLDNKLRVIKVNKSFEKLFQYKNEEIKGQNFKHIMHTNCSDCKKCIFENITNNDGFLRAEIISNRKNSELLNIDLYAYPVITKDKRTSICVICRDITENKSREKQINNLAFKDSLTGLYNRTFFVDKLKSELIKAQRKQEKLALLFIDLVDFKKINDNLGHVIGDKFLREVAKRFKQSSRENDIVARIGGDEFIILLPQINHIEDAVKIAEKVTASFEKSFIVDEHELYIYCSVGLSVYPDDGLDMDTLMMNADIAMYEAKESKENKVEIFTPDLSKKVSEEFILENELRHALNRNEFLIYYQPIVDINTEQIIGAEALLRWKSPKLGLVTLDKFIPLAEKNNLILSIGEWVLRNACKQNKKWIDMGLEPITIAVNISVKQLEEKCFIKLVENILKETGLDAKHLEFEVTESISAKNIDDIIIVLRKLNDLGIKLSIDDFGTGYSSLGQLKKLSINKLKIDRSFVSDINEDMDNTAIVSTIITMANILNLQVVAEGIETSKQLNFLKENDCDMGQGYLFSRPININLFEKLLKSNIVYN